MTEPEEKRKRALTDADVEALADKLEQKIIGRFDLNLGQGLRKLIWNGIVIALVGVAAYGAFKPH